MSTLATFTKQPADVQDYDIDFTEWLAGMNDTGLSQVTTISGAGATLSPAGSLAAGVVKVWVTGGVDGGTHKITCTLTTTAGRKKQAEITLKVKEI